MLLIKNMEMPKSCRKCPSKATFPNTGLKNGVCNDLHLPFRRHPYCPLIEVVTCKDCINWNKDLSPQTPTAKEHHFCSIMGCCTPDNFYCAANKKKEK